MSEGYSPRFVRFVRLPMHREAYEAAYLDQSQAARSELERLRREYETLPPRHAGWCPGECPSEVYALKTGRMPSPCIECRRLRRDFESFKASEVREIQRRARDEAPMPSVLMLDLERALSVLGERESAVNVARYLGWKESEEAA